MCKIIMFPRKAAVYEEMSLYELVELAVENDVAVSLDGNPTIDALRMRYVLELLVAGVIQA